MNKKAIVTTIYYGVAEVAASIIYPFFVFKTRFADRFLTILRSAVIKKYLVGRGATIGDKFVVGKKCSFRVQQGAVIHIGDNVFIGDAAMINVRSGATLSIGNNCHINFGSRVSCFEQVSFGNDCLVASFSNILDHDHEFDLSSPPSTKKYTMGPIVIGDGVWIGTKVQLGKGIRIGDYSVIGANSVVTKDLDASTVYGGVPAKVIRKKS